VENLVQNFPGECSLETKNRWTGWTFHYPKTGRGLTGRETQLLPKRGVGISQTKGGDSA